MFGQRPTFGNSSTSFGGFGTNTPSTGFGSSSFGRPVFGTPQQTSSTTTPFGTATSTGTSLFGQSQPTGGTGLFGSTTQSSTGFGTNTSYGNTGTGLFGATTQASNAGIFGSGSSTFNTQSQPRPFSFGTPTTSAGGSLFGSSNTGTILFGSNMGAQASGTTIKYTPVTGTDTINKGGTTSNIQTRLEFITSMKEYENKSLEELRMEDYAAGRKGPGAGGVGGGGGGGSAGFGFGQQNKFMPAQPSPNLFGAGATPNNLFGQKPPENKSLFGAPAFGAPTSGSSLFGTTTPAFGQTTTPSSTGFAFGQSTPAKPGAFSFAPTTSTQPLFGAANTPSQAGFGSAGFGFGNQPGAAFGQNKPGFGTTGIATGNSLFGQKPGTGFNTAGFGVASTASPFGTTNTPTGLGIFNTPTQNKPTGFTLGTSTGGFGTGTSGFGAGSIFGQSTNQAKPGGLNFGTTPNFGVNPSAGFGFGTNTGAGVFGSTAGGSLFGNPGSGLNAGTSAFGGGLGTGFGVNPLQTNSINLNNCSNSIVSSNNINNLIKALTHNPFGNSSLLKAAGTPTGKADELLNSTSGARAGSNDSSKSSTAKKPTYVLPSGSTHASKPRPIGLNKSINGVNGMDSGHHMLFAGLEEPQDLSSDDPFKPKSFPNVKKLNLRVFKNNKNDNQIQISADNYMPSENSISEAITPLTTPLSSLGVPETPIHSSLPPSHENSPTPDIIKGRSNIKRFNIPKKPVLNDTLADFVVGNRGNQNSEEDFNEANKENTNNISLFEASSLDNIPEAVSSTSLLESHPTGIKFSRTGYYTLPSLNELSEMIEDCKCLVENFTIGRFGYGNVCFPGVTDVFGLDLDATVFIVRKEVDIYPEGSDKPPKGEGLNKSAFVTLDCVWPVDKTTREIIKSEERLASMGWSDYLERQCLKMDASFVEYRPETGSWLFKVKHFSKYGLQDGEEEAAATAAANQIQQEATRGTRPKPIELSKSILASQLYGDSPLRLDLSSNTDGVHTPKSGVIQGPPVVGLTSPQNFQSPAMASEAVSFSRNRSYLDETTKDQDHFSSVAKEPDEGAYLTPMSPSAERLTLSSNISHRAVQSKKSHLFYDDQDSDDDIYSVEPSQKGVKRGIYSESVWGGDALKVVFNKQESLQSFKKDVSSKRILLTSDSFHHSVSDRSMTIPSLPREKTTFKAQNIIEPMFSQMEKPQSIMEDLVSAPLRDPKTTYQLLPSGKNVDAISDKFSLQHLSEEVPLQSSLISSVGPCISDASTFMSRSCRVGWGPGWTFVHTGTSFALKSIFSDSDDEAEASAAAAPPPFLFVGPSSSTVEPIAPKGTPRYIFAVDQLCLEESKTKPDGSVDTLLESCLLNVLELSSPDDSSESAMEVTTDDVCPYLQPEKGIELLHRLAGTASYVEDSEDRDRKLSSIFDLCVRLWGKLEFYHPELDGNSVYVESQYRKEALSQWLESVVEIEVSEEVKEIEMEGGKDSHLKAVFSYMTSRQIAEACRLSQDNGCHHLALLLAQVCLGSEIPRQIMQKQLMYWAEYKIDSLIPLQQLTLYSLIAGLATHKVGNVKVNTCHGLNWRRSLAIHLWYVCPATSTISETLLEYEKACGIVESNVDLYCDLPRPSYVTEKPSLVDIAVNYDICYHILKLYVDPSHPLDKLLEPSDFDPDPLNLTTSWLVWCVLESLNYNLLSKPKVTSLHLSMAALLEAGGHWHWAAFALLFIPQEERRRKEVNDLLDRHLLVDGEDGESDPLYKEKEHFLLSDLHLPIQWLNRAKAVRARSRKLIDEEAWYSIKASLYGRAHSLIVESIAPNAIINEDHGFLLHYLNEFDGDDVLMRIPDWDVGGGIYKDYLHLVDQIRAMKESGQLTGKEVEKLRPRLLGLCSKLNNLKTSTAVQRLSVSEMSRVVVSVLRAILGDDPAATKVLADQVSSLPLTHDCALEELNLITHQYLMQN